MTSQYIEINKLGSKFYFKDKAMKIVHREDGPAIEFSDGEKSWWLNGKRHREDGPAIEYVDGEKFWYLNGVYHSEANFLKQTAKETVLTMDKIAAKFGIEVSKLKISK